MFFFVVVVIVCRAEVGLAIRIADRPPQSLHSVIRRSRKRHREAFHFLRERANRFRGNTFRGRMPDEEVEEGGGGGGGGGGAE